ncbi:MAG: GGDEF domain-containing protein [Candidatus Accumulibacter sp.]|jgi:diguanylate cyclase (GGDEF)-like protein|nr:GGDEF domain-containing protein [Accumulibacter sp.]
MPAQDNQLAIAILQEMDVTIFKRLGPWRYELFGKPSPTFASFFLQGGDFWLQSEMLDFFLYDVEDYFEHGGVGGISSGVWQETGPDQDQEEASFLAHTLDLCGEQLLVVRTLGEEFQEKKRILQQARMNLLERQHLSAGLNEYRQKSRRDGLTGLFNRATFDELLQQNMSIAEKTGANLSLILIDIDDFKDVNDNYGHVVGDQVLSDIGRILQSILRREDAVCRYGGEEFAVLIQYATQEQVAQAAEKIRSHVESHSFGEPPRLTVSVGCSTYQMEESATSFINRADLALYEAKRGGKNRVVAD